MRKKLISRMSTWPPCSFLVNEQPGNQALVCLAWRKWEQGELDDAPTEWHLAQFLSVSAGGYYLHQKQPSRLLTRQIPVPHPASTEPESPGWGPGICTFNRRSHTLRIPTTVIAMAGAESTAGDPLPWTECEWMQPIPNTGQELNVN